MDDSRKTMVKAYMRLWHVFPAGMMKTFSTGVFWFVAGIIFYFLLVVRWSQRGILDMETFSLVMYVVLGILVVSLFIAATFIRHLVIENEHIREAVICTSEKCDELEEYSKNKDKRLDEIQSEVVKARLSKMYTMLSETGDFKKTPYNFSLLLLEMFNWELLPDDTSDIGENVFEEVLRPLEKFGMEKTIMDKLEAMDIHTVQDLLLWDERFGYDSGELTEEDFKVLNSHLQSRVCWFKVGAIPEAIKEGNLIQI